MLVGGALVNALAFSGSSYLFSKLREGSIEEERKRHDKAVEQLQKAQADWNHKRQERLDWVNEEMHRQGHALQTFQDVNDAIHEYNLVMAGKTHLDPLEAEPILNDFYTPSQDYMDREITFVIAGMGATALVAYYVSN